MHRILVEEKRWICESRFLHALNYCMLLPGPEAQQLATYIGWLMHRTRGGLMAGGLFILPGIVAIMALSWIYAAVRQCRRRLGPVLRAEGGGARHRARRRWSASAAGAEEPASWSRSPAAAFVAIFFFGVPFPLIVLAAGADRVSRRPCRVPRFTSAAAMALRRAQVADADDSARR